MKKIGIITHWQSLNNYGQILQGFALQCYIKKHGGSPFLIKYDPKMERSFWHKVKEKITVNNLLSIFTGKYFYRKKKYICEKKEIEASIEKAKQCNLALFREKHMNSTSHVYRNIEELRTNPPDADVYVCGSDQVWHDSYNEDNTSGWFLQFGNAKRVAYAASAGRDITDPHELAVMKKYLDTFQAISVREESLKKVCDGIGCPAEVVLDPTLLLDYSDYSSLITNEAHKPYIFIYILNIKDKNEIDWDTIKDYADSHNLDIRIVMSSGYYPARELIPNYQNEHLTVEDWLSGIANAEFVITTSFHGTVFSLIFEKNFIVFPLKDFSGANDRVKTLLDTVKLGERLVSKFDDEIIVQEINWDKVKNTLDGYKNTSEEFIRKNIL